ncbi:MAG: molybdopterin-dependent oxidoreductase [Dehalococcoidia bacterium]|nr:molybdopterin-dependent oxidoreductase [Dehalococcoidia bacterium]
MDSEVRTLTIAGEVDRPLALHFDELLQLPAVERRVQIVCASGEISDVVMRGVALTHVFELARVRGTARMAVFTCSDGHQERVSLADLIQQEAFLAYWVGEEQEEEPDSLPRLSIPGKVGSKWAKRVHTIELR